MTGLESCRITAPSPFLEASVCRVVALLFCNGGGFLSVKDAFSETGTQHFTNENKVSRK